MVVVVDHPYNSSELNFDRPAGAAFPPYISSGLKQMLFDLPDYELIEVLEKIEAAKGEARLVAEQIGCGNADKLLIGSPPEIKPRIFAALAALDQGLLQPSQVATFMLYAAASSQFQTEWRARKKIDVLGADQSLSASFRGYIKDISGQHAERLRTLLSEQPASGRVCFEIEIPETLYRLPNDEFTILGRLCILLGKEGLPLRLEICQQDNQKYKLILPSFEVMQSLLDCMNDDAMELVPRFGLCPGKQFSEALANQKNIFALQLPGVAGLLRGDGHYFGEYIASLHDFYHAFKLTTHNSAARIFRQSLANFFDDIVKLAEIKGVAPYESLPKRLPDYEQAFTLDGIRIGRTVVTFMNYWNQMYREADFTLSFSRKNTIGELLGPEYTIEKLFEDTEVAIDTWFEHAPEQSENIRKLIIRWMQQSDFVLPDSREAFIKQLTREGRSFESRLKDPFQLNLGLDNSCRLGLLRSEIYDSDSYKVKDEDLQKLARFLLLHAEHIDGLKKLISRLGVVSYVEFASEEVMAAKLIHDSSRLEPTSKAKRMGINWAGIPPWEGDESDLPFDDYASPIPNW